MTREELREHCENEIKMCNIWAIRKGEEAYRKIYEEHKLVLELLEQEAKSEWEHDHEILKAYSYGANEVIDKIRDEILDNAFSVVNPHNTYEYINVIDIDGIEEILDKYKWRK